ncbi:hypothetical protein B0537_10970 [Desulforamulus ferrireducens]|uniref:Uncharacterized protein n=1 Tax=Desulforamulus ferrireducens TaxID=1833852 RepID=A0A1S6IXP2_9FIRM|nr:hypothetical protein B0537_10970 [Desulforamulus ferrireducens]
MVAVCVLCNRLYTLNYLCPRCGDVLADQGLIQDFFDPYSSYEDQKIYEDGYQGYTEECCTHVLACGKCGWYEYKALHRLPEDVIN